MKGDQEKTKDQLINELESMRQRIADLESKGKEAKGPTRSPRTELHADIEFIGDFDIVQAKGINLSEGGICFELGEPLPFEIQFELGGNMRKHRAHLLWMKRRQEGRYRFGLKFVKAEPYPVI